MSKYCSSLKKKCVCELPSDTFSVQIVKNKRVEKKKLIMRSSLPIYITLSTGQL